MTDLSVNKNWVRSGGLLPTYLSAYDPSSGLPLTHTTPPSEAFVNESKISRCAVKGQTARGRRSFNMTLYTRLVLRSAWPLRGRSLDSLPDIVQPIAGTVALHSGPVARSVAGSVPGLVVLLLPRLLPGQQRCSNLMPASGCCSGPTILPHCSRAS